MFKLLELLKIKFDGELTLADGKTQIEIHGSLATGAKIYFFTSDGVKKAMPEGTYTLATGEQIDVDKNGVITNITATAVNDPSPDNPPKQTQPTDTVIPSGLPNASDAIGAEKQEIEAEKQEFKADAPITDTTTHTHTHVHSTPAATPPTNTLPNTPVTDPNTPVTDPTTPTDSTDNEDTCAGCLVLTQRVDALEQTVQQIQSQLQNTNDTLLASKEEIETIKNKATFAKEIVNIPSSEGTNEGTNNVAGILKTYLDNK